MLIWVSDLLKSNYDVSLLPQFPPPNVTSSLNPSGWGIESHLPDSNSLLLIARNMGEKNLQALRAKDT